MIEPNEAKQAIRELEEIMCDTDGIYRRNAIGIAISALEKYIPEDAVQDEKQFFTGKCPICGYLIGRETGYCPKCAQAIKWTKEPRT